LFKISEHNYVKVFRTFKVFKIVVKLLLRYNTVSECENLMNNPARYRELGSWLEEHTSLERGKDSTGLVWPGGSIEEVLAEYFGTETMVVSPSVLPRSNDKIHVYSSKHNDLPYEDLTDFNIEYGWALGETLTELAEPEEPNYSGLTDAVENLADVSEKLVDDNGTSIYNVEGLNKPHYNSTASEEGAPSNLNEWAELLYDELEDLEYDVSIEEPPVLETPHIIIDF
jgi:hypothetical protein